MAQDLRPLLAPTVEDRLRSLEDWRLETRTTNRILGRILTAIFGVSLIGLIANIVSIVVILSQKP